MFKSMSSQQRFSIRKYTIGVASVLIGLAFLTAPTVSADELMTDKAPVAELVTQPVTEEVVESPILLESVTSDVTPESIEVAPPVEEVPAPPVPVTEPVASSLEASVTPVVEKTDEVVSRPVVSEEVIAPKAEEKSVEPVATDSKAPATNVTATEPSETDQSVIVTNDNKVEKVVSTELTPSEAREGKSDVVNEESQPVSDPELEKGPTSGRTAFRTVVRNPANLAPSGVYYFTASAGVKAEPKLSSPDLAKYSAGQSVNYDKLVTADNHQWISYISYSGNRRYIAVKELPKAQPAPAVPVNQPTQPSKPIAESGVYTFTERVGVKAEPKLSSPDLAYYNAGSSVKYDSKLIAEGHQWISYISYAGGRSYIPIAKVNATTPSTPKPVEAPKPIETPKPVSTPAVNTIPSSGVYTFTQRVSIKAEPKLSSTELAFYNAGDKVKYDSTLVADGHNWISYISYAGGRSYIAVSKADGTALVSNQPVAPKPVAQPVNSGLTSPNGRPDYSPNAYPKGECTWGAKEAAPWASNYWGNGGQWANNARRDGFTVGTIPVVGAIAVWPGGADPRGHVAVVTEVVNNNLIRVVESNMNGKRYLSDHQGLFDPNNPYTGGNVSYIYPPSR